MKADNPYFMVSVALLEVQKRMEEAHRKLEENLPNVVLTDVRFSIQKLAFVMEELHMENLRQTRSEAYKRGLHDRESDQSA